MQSVWSNTKISANRPNLSLCPWIQNCISWYLGFNSERFGLIISISAVYQQWLLLTTAHITVVNGNVLINLIKYVRHCKLADVIFNGGWPVYTWWIKYCWLHFHYIYVWLLETSDLRHFDTRGVVGGYTQVYTVYPPLIFSSRVYSPPKKHNFCGYTPGICFWS